MFRRHFLSIIPASLLPLSILPRKSISQSNTPPGEPANEMLRQAQRMRAFAEVWECNGRGCYSYLQTQNGRYHRLQIKDIKIKNPECMVIIGTAPIKKNDDSMVGAVIVGAVIMSPSGAFVSQQTWDSISLRNGDTITVSWNLQFGFD